MANPVLYSGSFCPFCKKVEGFIKSEDLQDKVSIVNINKDAEARDRLVEGGGKSQIPCLEYEGSWLYESNDIINWLEEKYL